MIGEMDFNTLQGLAGMLCGFLFIWAIIQNS